jgi:ATP-dependent Clp protease adaptor protein ClpS
MPYQLVLLNDNEHTFDYVIDMLVANFPIPEDRAIEHAMDVHANGRTIVVTGEKDAMESSRDRILACGPDPRLPRSSGSMKVLLEPSE